MPPAFFYVWHTLFNLIAFVYPFVRLFCGGRFFRTVVVAWALLVLYVFLVCGVLPSIVWHYNKTLAYRMGDLHFEPPFILFIFVFGWFYPLAASTLGGGCRYLLRRFFSTARTESLAIHSGEPPPDRHFRQPTLTQPGPRHTVAIVKVFTAIIERCPDTGLYVGFVPGFAGAHSQGESLDELQRNLREVIEMLLEDGEPDLETEFVGTQSITVAA